MPCQTPVGECSSWKRQRENERLDWETTRKVMLTTYVAYNNKEPYTRRHLRKSPDLPLVRTITLTMRLSAQTVAVLCGGNSNLHETLGCTGVIKSPFPAGRSQVGWYAYLMPRRHVEGTKGSRPAPRLALPRRLVFPCLSKLCPYSLTSRSHSRSISHSRHSSASPPLLGLMPRSQYSTLQAPRRRFSDASVYKFIHMMLYCKVLRVAARENRRQEETFVLKHVRVLKVLRSRLLPILLPDKGYSLVKERLTPQWIVYLPRPLRLRQFTRTNFTISAQEAQQFRVFHDYARVQPYVVSEDASGLRCAHTHTRSRGLRILALTISHVNLLHFPLYTPTAKERRRKTQCLNAILGIRYKL
ncbi:hypothetical protein EAG_05395 [Camponotus floridanus]|uniref:Uncharacterized protein n=1 Tax=Camponotus floridanus TaxID=104421 RepID=E2A5X7_CAMFO|nr:hypothetical protein EAG_05395 [Camponotus floridanus]